MEEDPLVTQRMRDIARTQMCDSHASAYNKCGGEQVNDRRGVFSTGVVGALVPAILGHFSSVGKLRVLNKNLIITQHPHIKILNTPLLCNQLR